MREGGARMLDSLPAIYRAADSQGHLKHLLEVFEAVLFGDAPDSAGIEQQIDTIPSFFSPQGDEYTDQFSLKKTPDRFLPWLATWVAFTPQALFAPERLRSIISGIAPLYARRGTRDYLKQLLKLCFPEILELEINDDPKQRFIIGKAKIGEDTLFGDERPFWFRVDINMSLPDAGSELAEPKHAIERRIRAIIAFAKPAHTDYELRLNFSEGEKNVRYTV